MELSEIRSRIDGIDQQLLRLFLQRMDLAEDVAAYKREHSLPICNKPREREILREVMEASGDRERYSYQLFSLLMQLSRARQAELMADTSSALGAQLRAALDTQPQTFPQTGLIACQGTEGSNSQAACDKLFPRGSLVYMKNFAAVFDAVESGLCSFGVLPIENSSNGSVRAVYELLQHKHFSIVRSTRLCIRHELLALPGVAMEDIREIRSHPQAIGQCSHYLASLPGVQVVPCANTALAAQEIARNQDRHAAAIASPACRELYGLRCLNDRIQDSENNYTRFLCIARDPVIYSGANRLSLVLSCANRPGALYDILGQLAALGINMTKLESCPVSGRDFEFLFFLELEADLHSEGVLPMLLELERSCESFQLLGHYAEV